MRKTIFLAFLFCMTVGTLSAKRPKKIQKTIVDSIETSVKTDSVNAEYTFPMIAIGNIRFLTDTVYPNVIPYETDPMDTLNHPIFDKKQLLDFFVCHVTYPSELRQTEAEDCLMLRFDIDKHGNIRNPKVSYSIHPEMKDELLRVLSHLPEFIAQKERLKSTLYTESPVVGDITIEVPVFFKILKL